MTEADIRDALRAYAAAELVPGRTLGDDESMIDSGILDSLKMVNLTGFIEREIGIAIDDDDLDPDHFETIAALAAFLAHKRRG